ncbi:hypothetical protein K788_0001772 (plasmid) [Paraburkholderia caribensis MBA4]|uniref:Uncharacterized protein n=1 Tax=Paraburkholderia caribensis MBA4 TaxID=1323664 RepID=A0A0P0RR07_9BURK|nr:hypothetical protein K788_0001772 [Paraburkholderia caribensis MBA4]
MLRSARASVHVDAAGFLAKQVAMALQPARDRSRLSAADPLRN